MQLDACPVRMRRMSPAVLLTTHARSASDCAFVPSGTLLDLISLLFRIVSAAWSEDVCPRGFKQALLQQGSEERHLQAHRKTASARDGDNHESSTDLHKNRLLSFHPVNQGCLSVKIDATNFDRPTSPVLVRCAWLSLSSPCVSCLWLLPFVCKRVSSRPGHCLQGLLSIHRAFKLLSMTAQPKAHSPLIGASLRHMEGPRRGLVIARRACLYLSFEVFTCCG